MLTPRVIPLPAIALFPAILQKHRAAQMLTRQPLCN
jgi:hypothetical protein